MMMSENYYEERKMPPLFGSTFDTKSIMKRKRGASVTSRLRTASDLEELGLVDLAEKGKLKDYIISGDAKAASALDNYDLYGDTNEFKEFIGQIKEGLPNVDIIEGIQFDTISIRPRTNSCRLLSFDSDLNFDLLDDMNDNIYSDAYGHSTENDTNHRELRNLSGNNDEFLYTNQRNENINDINDLLKKEDIKHRQSSRAFSIQSFESLCDNGLDVDNFSSTSFRKNSLSGYDIDYFNVDSNGNSRDVSWADYSSNHIFNDISNMATNITPTINGDYNQNHTIFQRQSGKENEVDMSAYDAVALGASKMTNKVHTNKKRINTPKQSHLQLHQDKSHNFNHPSNNNTSHHSSITNISSTYSQSHNNSNDIKNNFHSTSSTSSVVRKPTSLHNNMIISSSSIPTSGSLLSTSSNSLTNTMQSLPYPPPPGSDLSGFVGVYSPERRRERIQRFFEKRQRRVWTKKVKYDVRKNFADSRIRVKGRFVRKEDEDLLRVLGVFEEPGN